MRRVEPLPSTFCVHCGKYRVRDQAQIRVPIHSDVIGSFSIPAKIAFFELAAQFLAHDFDKQFSSHSPPAFAIISTRAMPAPIAIPDVNLPKSPPMNLAVPVGLL